MIKVNNLVMYLWDNLYLSKDPSWPTESYTCLSRLLDLIGSEDWIDICKTLNICNGFLDEIKDLDINLIWNDGEIPNETLRNMVYTYNQILQVSNESLRLIYTPKLIKFIYEECMN